MDSCAAFRPKGATTVIAAAATAPPPIQIGGPVSGDVAIMVYNSGAVVAFLAYGPNAATATANAVAPIAGTPSNTIPIPPGTQTFTLTGNLWYTAVAASATTLYVTPGEGI
jgi:hypothetical protein